MPFRTPGKDPADAPLVVTDIFSDSDWDGFVERHADGTVEHLASWQSIYRRVFRHDPSYLIARRGNVVTGVLPLVRMRSPIFGCSMISLPYTSYGGLLTSDPETSNALIDHARGLAQRFGASRAELRNVSRHCQAAPVQTHKVGARLLLPSSTDKLWNGLDKKVRNLIRKGQKENLTLQRGRFELIDEFYAVFAENMRDLGTPVFPRGLFEEVLQTFAQANVFIVRSGQAATAAGIVLPWRRTVLVPWASALRRYRHLSPNMLLYWSMLESAVNDGYEVFDFGRSTRDGGTHHFKRQWGASDFPLYWERVHPADSATSESHAPGSGLQLLVNAWTRMPLPIANWLGPRVIRHVG